MIYICLPTSEKERDRDRERSHNISVFVVFLSTIKADEAQIKTAQVQKGGGVSKAARDAA